MTQLCSTGRVARVLLTPVAPVRTPFNTCRKALQERRQVAVKSGGDDIRNGRMEKSMFGEDFGARDPFAGELASNFADKVLGHADTEHILKPPDAMAKVVGLKAKKCVPCEGGNVPKLTESQAEVMRKQVPGWKFAETKEGHTAIRQDFKVKNFVSGLELFKRIAAVAEEEGHHPDLHLEGYNNASVVLSTHSVGGLTENDFILASKINDVPVKDLQPARKARFWA